ncbi:MAG: SH3 domain-containing protein [Candidatus Acidiferrales bacterium]
MIRPLVFVLALWIAGLASPAKAGGNTNVKCAVNEDRVWVYESLDDFNVAAKLKCGDPVQIIGRVKGYVKIETANGTDGYVLDSAVPKSALPPEPDEKPNTVEAASLAFAARRASKPSTSAASPVPAAAATETSAPAASSSAPVAVAARPTPIAPAKSAPTPPQPAVTVAATTSPATNSASQPTSVPATTPSVVYAAASASTPSSAPAASASSTVTAPVPPAPAAPKTVAKYSSPQPIAPAPAKKHKPAPAASAEPAAAAPESTVEVETASAPAAAPDNPAPRTSISISSVEVSAPAPSVANNAAVNPDAATNRVTAETSASLQPVSGPDARPVVAPVKPRVNPDDEDDPSYQPLDEDTANCTHYFSAYGLSPNQYKWIAQNRHKAFPSVCPAPTPAMVDFVVIFTHDVAFYNVTMPNAIHVEQNGFSDWTPLGTVDTALMTASEADKSHHEYVWVFHTTRGAFDPAKFSSRRRPLYSKSETNTLGSRGGFRTVMDALTFIEQNGTTNR